MKKQKDEQKQQIIITEELDNQIEKKNITSDSKKDIKYKSYTLRKRLGIKE